MNKKIYELTALIALVLSGILAFFDFKISLGILVASLFSMANLYLLSFSMKNMLKGEKNNPGMMMLVSMARFLLLAVVMFLAMRFPEKISIIGVAIGLTLVMIALLVDALKKKGGARNGSADDRLLYYHRYSFHGASSGIDQPQAGELRSVEQA